MEGLMTLTLYNITFIAGLALIVVGVLGGGLEIKELKINNLSTLTRGSSFLLGCILLFVCVAYPNLFQGASPAASPPQPKPEPAVAVHPPAPPPKPIQSSKALSEPILVAYAIDQKAFADKLKDHLRASGYTINPHLDDFSGIRPEARETAGTIRIVYKQAAREAEVALVDAMRAKFPSEMRRLVETLNNGASVDLQVQLW